MRTSKTTLTMIGAALIAILSLGYAGYSTLTPHSATLTQQQFLTSTENFYSTQTETVTSTNTVSSVVIVSNSAISLSGGGPPIYETCGYYGCYPAQGYAYTPCQPSGTGNTVTCYGYLIKNGNGCVQVSVPTSDPDYWRSGVWYVHYALQNLPTSYPTIGTWVYVTGQLNISNTSIVSANAASCSPNTISVISMAAASPP